MTTPHWKVEHNEFTGIYNVNAWGHHALTGRPRYAAFRKRGEVYETASRPMTINEFKVTA